MRYGFMKQHQIELDALIARASAFTVQEARQAFAETLAHLRTKTQEHVEAARVLSKAAVAQRREAAEEQKPD